EEYAFAYIHTGRSFSLKLGELSGDRVVAWWYDPRNGTAARIGEFDNTGVRTFDPPDEPGDSNDWGLALDDASQSFGEPRKPMYDSWGRLRFCRAGWPRRPGAPPPAPRAPEGQASAH